MIYLLFVFIFSYFCELDFTRKKCRFLKPILPTTAQWEMAASKIPIEFFPHAKNISKSYKCACFYGIQWVKKGENITMFFDIFLHFMPKKKMSKLQIIKVARFSFIPLWDCFELRACFTGRCLCRQNINKYSNKPAQRVF